MGYYIYNPTTSDYIEYLRNELDKAKLLPKYQIGQHISVISYTSGKHMEGLIEIRISKMRKRWREVRIKLS